MQITICVIWGVTLIQIVGSGSVGILILIDCDLRFYNDNMQITTRLGLDMGHHSISIDS